MKFQKNKQGFTLVELIVVLVILAILAALLVPALTGYIDRAKEKKVTAEAKGIWTVYHGCGHGEIHDKFLYNQWEEIR